MTTNTSPLSAAALSSLEMASIKALVAYTAYDKKVSEDVVRSAVVSHFGIEDLDNLPRNSFNDAIHFLVDIQTEILTMN